MMIFRNIHGEMNHRIVWIAFMKLFSAKNRAACRLLFAGLFLLPFVFLGCGDDDGGGEQCGNGIVEEGEVCEGDDLQGETCESLGFVGGELSCHDDCTSFETKDCVAAVCGDGVAEGEEECDSEDLRGKTCQELGFAGGELICTDDCIFDLSDCGEGCGNGVREGDEECDREDLGGMTCLALGFSAGELGCDESCTFDLADCVGGCGNGVREGTEECDWEDLGDHTCEELGFGEGDLSCDSDCFFNVSQCEEGGAGVGGECSVDEDCAKGMCFTELEYGWPSGYCLDDCEPDGSCVDEDADCALLGDRFLCLRGCQKQTYPSDCRVGYTCESAGAESDVCLPSCKEDQHCPVTGLCEKDIESPDAGLCVVDQEVCDSGVDEDMDGYTDCEDYDCIGECPTGEICDSGVDDDGDGLTDCEDGECRHHVVCTGVECVKPGVLNCGDVLAGEANDATGSADIVDNWCGAAGWDSDGWYGPEFGYELAVNESKVVVVRVEGLTGDLDLFVVRDEGDQGCNPYYCYAHSTNMQPYTDYEEVEFQADPGFTYYIIVDGWKGDKSFYDIYVDCYNP